MCLKRSMKNTLKKLEVNSLLLKLEITLNSEPNHIYRNIVFPIEKSIPEVLEILYESIPEATVVSFVKEKVVSWVDEYNSEGPISSGLIDKYWIDTIEYVIEVEYESKKYKTILIICDYEMSKFELMRKIEPVFKYKNIRIDELADCWLLKEEYY